jgi:hypothetical protein
MIPRKQINFTAFNKELHVHPSGSDTEGTGSSEKPFLTLEKARDEAIAGTLIIVHEGNYTVTTTDTNGLGKDQVSWYFLANTTITKSSAGNMFGTAAMSNGYNVYGYGVFIKNTNTGIIYSNNIDTDSGKMFECSQAINSVGRVIDIIGGNVIFIKAVYMSSAFSDVIKIQNSVLTQHSITIDVEHCSCSAAESYPINLAISDADVSITIRGCRYYNSNENYGVYSSGESKDLLCQIGFCTGYYINTRTNLIINGNSDNIDLTDVYSATINGYCNYAAITSSNSNEGILFNGRVETLHVISGNVIATNVNLFNITGGSIRILQLIRDFSTTTYSIITGGVCIVDNGASANEIIVNGGHLIYNGGTNNYLGSSEGPNFNLQAGKLEIRGRVKNPNTGSGTYNCINWTSGILILNGAILTTADPEGYAIVAVNSGLNLKILSGGVSVNKTNDILTARTQLHRIYITQAVNGYTYTHTVNETPYQYNATSGDTTITIAANLAALVQAEEATTVNYTSGNDYYDIIANVAGTSFTSNIAVENMSEVVTRMNSCALTELTGGSIITNTNVE